MDTTLDLAGFTEVPADSEIHVSGDHLEKAIVAVDVDIGALLLARQLGADCVIAHHPVGGDAIIYGYRVFERHLEQMTRAGVPREVADRAVQSKMSSLAMARHIMDPDRVPKAAERLGLALLSIHSPCDEVGRRIMAERVQRTTDDVNSPRLRDVVNALEQIPELASATTKIDVRLGNLDGNAGRVVVSHGAFTNGGFEVADAYFSHGIGTVVYIHLLEPDLARLQAEGRGNVVVTGHIASDWIGLNRLCNVLESQGLQTIRLGR